MGPQDLRDAALISYIAHRKQVDKADKPYFDHPRRVAEMAQTIEIAIVAFLHDVVEDSFITIDYIYDLFGEEIANAVEAITHRKNEPNEDYYQRIATNELAFCVKILDIADNTDSNRLGEIENDEFHRLMQKYSTGINMLLKANIPLFQYVIESNKIPGSSMMFDMLDFKSLGE